MKTTIKNFLFILIATVAMTIISCGKDEVVQPDPITPVDTTTHNPNNPVSTYKRTYVSEFTFDSTKTMILYRNAVNTNKIDSIFKIKNSVKGDTTFIRPNTTSDKIVVSYNGSAWSFSEITKMEKQDTKYIVTGDFGTATKSAKAGAATEYKSLIVEVAPTGTATVTYTATNESDLMSFGGSGLFATPDASYSYNEKTNVTSVVISTTAVDHSFVDGVFTLSQSKLLADGLMYNNYTLKGGTSFYCNKIMKTASGEILAYLRYTTSSGEMLYKVIRLLDSNGNINVICITNLVNTPENGFFKTASAYMVNNQTSHFLTTSTGMNIGNFYGGDSTYNFQQTFLQPHFLINRNDSIRVVRIQLSNNNDGFGCNRIQINKVIMYKGYMYFLLQGKINDSQRIDGMYRVNINTILNQPIEQSTYYTYVNLCDNNAAYLVTSGRDFEVVTDAANSYLGFKQGNNIKMCKADGSVSTLTVEDYNSNTINF